jgi:predicted PurR-regulated permease PerM
MDKLKTLIKEPSFLRSSLFIVFNAFLLYVLFFAIKNADHIFSAITFAAGELINAFSVLFIGLIIAYLLNPLVTRIDEHLLRKAIIRNRHPERSTKKRESICRLVSIFITIFIVLAAFILIIYGFSAMILGQFVFTDMSKTVEAFMMNLANYETELKLWISEHFADGFLSEKIRELASIVIIWVSDNFSAAAAVETVSSAIGSIINFVIGLIISIYLLMDKELFINMWNKFLALIFPEKVSPCSNNQLFS